MDHFGIGQGVEAATRIYFQSGRQTGRTVSLVESVKAGDRVVFADSREAERVKRLCKERDIEIETIVVDPRTPQRIFERGSSQGRTIFDHSWVEQYYMDAIDRAQEAIDHLERETSGYGEAHRETRRKAEEMAKWRF
jgi:hypothetical protein